MAEAERLEKVRERDAMWARIDSARQKVRAEYAREQEGLRRQNEASGTGRVRETGDWRGEQDFLSSDRRRPVRLPFGGSLPDDFL